jgi:hypothetical protein
MINRKPTLQTENTVRRTRFTSLILGATATLAALILSGTAAEAATNVLNNPGFETGSISSWTGVGACYNPPGAFVESTNSIVYQGTSHVITHSAQFAGKTFGGFCSAAGTRPSIYQEVGTGADSVWSADGWASTQTPDNIAGGNQFWFEVSFRDAGNTVLGLYRSSVIDNTTATGTYFDLQVTNQIDPGDLTTVIGTATSFAAPAGTVKVRYEVVFAQTAFDGGSVYFDDLNLTKIAGSDPEISGPPASQTKVAGQTATFTAVASGVTTLSYVWQKTTLDAGTLTLSNGGNVSGATTSTLHLANVTPADAATYTVTVTDAHDSQSATAKLKVVTQAEVATNMLVNAGFEDGIFSNPWESGWQVFNGNHLANTNEFYYLSATPVAVFDGGHAAQIYSSGNESYNGIFQDKPALPGQVYTANAWFLTPTEDRIGGNNVCYLEVQFRDAGDAVLAQYSSFLITSTTNFPADTWINLAPTNHQAGDFTTSLGTSPYLVAPPNTTKVRYQVTYHAVDAGGSVYVDGANLRLREPVVTAARSGGNLQLSFPTISGPTYQVLYKTNLTDATWQVLTSVAGDGTVKTVPEALGSVRRFYIVNTQ